VGTPSGESGGSAQACGKPAEIAPGKAWKAGGKSRPKKRRRPVRHRFGARTDDGPIALRAFWSMHVEAMNWSGMGFAEYAAALGLSPHALRKWCDRFEDSKVEMDWRSLRHPSAQAQLSSAANCAAALATLPGLVRPPDGMMAIDWTMGSEACAETDGYCVVFVIFPRFCTVLDTSIAKENWSFRIVTAMLLLARTGAGQVPSSCPRRVGVGCWRRNFGIESGAHGRHFNAGKIDNSTRCSGFALPCGPAETGAEH
jgi:hypothetical protein